MNPALAQDPRALRVNLTAPTTAIRIGPFSFDGLKALLGFELAELLAPMMVGPKFQRPILGGFIDVYPLAIPNGEGLTIPVKLVGGVGFRNLHGALVIQVPPAMVDLVRAELRIELANGEALGPANNDNGAGGTVTEFALRLRPGMRKAHSFRIHETAALPSRIAVDSISSAVAGAVRAPPRAPLPCFERTDESIVGHPGVAPPLADAGAREF